MPEAWGGEVREGGEEGASGLVCAHANTPPPPRRHSKHELLMLLLGRVTTSDPRPIIPPGLPLANPSSRLSKS